MSRGSAENEEEESSGDDSEFDSLLRQIAGIDDEPPSPPLPTPGQVIGEKYRIEERIGRGGMGAVFRASHVVSQKPVAVKWMLRSASDEHAQRRFLREARVAGRIDHPNVVNVYDVGQDGDCGYLVMELLHGEALRARLERGPLQVAEAVDLLVPAMRGVAAVHQAGVIHRDLKPDNIFLCKGPDGTPREAKVLDFGISAMTATDPTDPTLTKDGAVLGTPSYMSPEQLQSVREIDVRADVYSFGVILYESLTGKLPFDAESYPGLVLAIVHGQPKPLMEVRPDLPRAVERVVLRAIAKSRDDRYASIDSLITALLPFGTARGTDSGFNAQLAAPAQVNAPRRRTWALVAGVLVALGCAAWLMSQRGAVARQTDARAPSPTALVPVAPVRTMPQPLPTVPPPTVGSTAPALRGGASGSTAPALRGGASGSTAPALRGGASGSTAPALRGGASGSTAPALRGGASGSTAPALRGGASGSTAPALRGGASGSTAPALRGGASGSTAPALRGGASLPPSATPASAADEKPAAELKPKASLPSNATVVPKARAGHAAPAQPVQRSGSISIDEL